MEWGGQGVLRGVDQNNVNQKSTKTENTHIEVTMG